MTEFDTNDTNLVRTNRQYRHSRTKRVHRSTTDSFNREFKKNRIPTRVDPALLWSFIVTFFSVGNPLFIDLANNLQTQALYAGMAMKAGQSPYGDFFSNDGVLYHFINFIGTFLGNTLVLVVLQFIALVIAGIYFYKLTAYFSRSRETANQMSIWFYLFILAFGFGGFYASIFALPFVLSSLWFLVRYFDNAVRDESFILYGMNAALVFMIYPKSIMLWIVASLVLLVYNIRHKRKARGLYQLLASLFGFLLITYSVGYYTFIKQILGMAISQTFFYNLQLKFTSEMTIWVAGVTLMILFFTGFLKNFITTLASMPSGKWFSIKMIAILTFLAQTVFILGNPMIDLSQFILVLPYGFIMALASVKEKKENPDKKKEESAPYNYLHSQLFLPILICLIIPIQPVVTFVLDEQIVKERVEVASYIQSQADKDAVIYTWDNSAEIYLKSAHLSASRFITAQPYLTNESNKAAFYYDLNNNKAQYVVVNKELSLPAKLRFFLNDNYKKEKLSVSHFTVYKKK